MKLKQISTAELELRQHLTATFQRVIRRGISFDPRLVTRDGQIVDEVPTEIDRYLMLAHRIHMENRDETQAEVLATAVASIIMAELRAERDNAA
jgi:hypothetical protein